MTDGNNADAAQSKVEELEAKLAEKDAEIAKLSKMNEDAQKQIGTQANEIGDVRKLREDYASMKEQLDALKNSNEQVPPKKEDNTEESVEDLENSLDDDQRKLVEVVWEQLSEEEKKAFDSDDKFRKEILGRAKTEIQAVPDSPWRKKPAKKQESGLNQRLSELFSNAKKNATFVPSGPVSGRASASGRGVGPQKDTDGSGNDEASRRTRAILGPHAR